MYFLIYCNEDGEISVNEFKKEELLKAICDQTDSWGSVGFYKKLPDEEPVYWDKLLIIKGDIVTPNQLNVEVGRTDTHCPKELECAQEGWCYRKCGEHEPPAPINLGRKMEKRNEICQELTKGFILREYYTMFPEMQIMGDIEKRAIKKYQIDPYFHTRVDTVVNSIKLIIEKY